LVFEHQKNFFRRVWLKTRRRKGGKGGGGGGSNSLRVGQTAVRLLNESGFF